MNCLNCLLAHVSKRRILFVNLTKNRILSKSCPKNCVGKIVQQFTSKGPMNYFGELPNKFTSKDCPTYLYRRVAHN